MGSFNVTDTPLAPILDDCKAPSTTTKKEVWRSGVSIPVPADCEPTALPSELHPHVLAREHAHTINKQKNCCCSLQAMGFEPMPLSRLAPKASALTTRPNLQHTQCCRAKTDHIAASLARPREAERASQQKMKSVPGGTRTPNPQIRSLMRYPLRHWDNMTQTNNDNNLNHAKRSLKKKYSGRGLNSRPSACKADVITTRRIL